MSREINFRVWVKRRKGYRELDQLVLNNQGLEEIWAFPKDGEMQQVYHPSEVIIEQYTGLKDKNGKEIYEGDILKFIKDPEMARVVWNTPSAEFHIKWLECGVSDSLSWHLHGHGGAEVIGNIHEPPKDFRPEHLKRMGVSISKGGEE